MNRKQGFTLVELMVAIGLMALLVTILATILQSAQEMYDLARIRAKVEANGKNAIETLERDMSKLITLSNDFTRYEFLLRSKPWDIQISSPEDEVARYYDSPYPPDENDENITNACLLSFYATADYYDAEDEIRKYKVCRIRYYLKKRKPQRIGEGGGTSDKPGAYLIRRIEPFKIDSENGNILWQTPIEEDVCSYVRGLRIWYYERDALLNDKDIKFIECTNIQTGNNPLPNTDIWDTQLECVKFKMQDDWSSDDKPFAQQHFLPPAIMVEIHVIDENASAYRIARKIINIPVAPVVLPKKPGAW